MLLIALLTLTSFLLFNVITVFLFAAICDEQYLYHPEKISLFPNRQMIAAPILVENFSRDKHQSYFKNDIHR